MADKPVAKIRNSKNLHKRSILRDSEFTEDLY